MTFSIGSNPLRGGPGRSWPMNHGQFLQMFTWSLTDPVPPQCSSPHEPILESSLFERGKTIPHTPEVGQRRGHETFQIVISTTTMHIAQIPGPFLERECIALPFLADLDTSRASYREAEAGQKASQMWPY